MMPSRPIGRDLQQDGTVTIWWRATSQPGPGWKTSSRRARSSYGRAIVVRAVQRQKVEGDVGDRTLVALQQLEAGPPSSFIATTSPSTTAWSPCRPSANPASSG